MKKHFQLTKDSKHNRVSIKWTWTFLAALALFFTYMVFSTFLFVSVQRILMENEKNNVTRVNEAVVEELQLHTLPLDEELVDSYFSFSDLNIAALINMEEDERFEVPVQNGIIIRVFNPDEEMVFSTYGGEFEFEPTEDFEIDTIEGFEDAAYSGVSPVQSLFNDELIGYVQVINTLEAYHKVNDQILSAIVFIGLIALVFSGIFGFLIAKGFLTPIRSLTAAMNKIRKKPDSEERILNTEGNDELSEMARSYNTMIDRMQENIENQKQFVEDVSHELRTPVAVVEGHLNLLDRWGKEDPEILKESIQASLQEIQRMKSLVQEMLDLSRAEQVDIQYKHEKTNAAEMLKLCYTNFKMIHPEFEFKLTMDEVEEVYVHMNRNHLEQVIVILLDNAVKYSTDKLEIHLALSIQEDNRLLLSIQDFGEGMSEEDEHKIFNRFYRVDKARSRDKGGNGLGLSIARELIKGYGGEIWVESILDFGSVFKILLPILDEKSENEE